MGKTAADILIEGILDWGVDTVFGLYVTIFNWLEGPPAFAPALFTGFAAVGLIAVYFL